MGSIDLIVATPPVIWTGFARSFLSVFFGPLFCLICEICEICGFF